MFLVRDWPRWPLAPRSSRARPSRRLTIPTATRSPICSRDRTRACASSGIRSSPMQLTLALIPSKLQAFDTMGNAIPITGTTTSTIQVAAERPTFFQCNIADYAAFDTAMSEATGRQRMCGKHRNDPNRRRCPSDADRRSCPLRWTASWTCFRRQPNAEGLAAGPNVLRAGAGTEPVVHVRGARQSGGRPGARPLWRPANDRNQGFIHDTLKRRGKGRMLKSQHAACWGGQLHCRPRR